MKDDDPSEAVVLRYQKLYLDSLQEIFDKNKEDSIDFDLANDVWLNKKFRFERFLYNNGIVTEEEFKKLRNECYYGKDFITWDKLVTKWYEEYYSKRFTVKVITIELKAVLTCNK